MGEPREYGPKGGTVLFLDLLAIFSPNLSEIEKNSVPALGTVLQGVPLISFLPQRFTYLKTWQIYFSQFCSGSSHPYALHSALEFGLCT